MHWTAHPFPVASGGLSQAPGFRPLRGPPAASVRQPDLGGAARIFGLSGFGAGMGATIRAHGQDADVSAGLITIWTGTTAPSASGVVQLSFPAPLGAAYWVAADWASFTLTPSGNVLMCNWTANRTLLAREVLNMVYQWAVST